MLIKKEDSNKKENSMSCTVWEYNFPNKQLGLATALIKGRYPDHGKAKNNQCEMIYYVLSGKGTIHTEDGDFDVNEGDSFFFKKSDWYWIEGNNLYISIVNAPAWFPEQYQALP